VKAPIDAVINFLMSLRYHRAVPVALSLNLFERVRVAFRQNASTLLAQRRPAARQGQRGSGPAVLRLLQAQECRPPLLSRKCLRAERLGEDMGTSSSTPESVSAPIGGKGRRAGDPVGPLDGNLRHVQGAQDRRPGPHGAQWRHHG
jgi:hypothetical protein